MKRGPPSLKRPLIVKPLIFQLVTLLIACTFFMALALRMDSGGLYTDEAITPVIARAIVRDRNGALSIRETPELAKLRETSPDIWFVAEDDSGQNVTSGEIPSQYASLLGRLGDLSYAHLRDRSPPYRLSAVIRREIAPAGTLTILGHGKLTGVNLVVLLASNFIVIPIFLALALISLLVTPWIVRQALAGVSRIAKEAEQIDANRRGRRLSEEHVPREIAPLVRAVNDALRRLDEGYEQQRRFIASAAHELRTPIAILRLKIDTAVEPATRKLSADVARLSNLAEQMLDIQRLDAERVDENIELGALARRVAADLAPLLIASARTIEVQIEGVSSLRGDAGAIERVMTNLVQNAIEHGGRHVILRVTGSGFEVEDDGPGIPLEERERVFEPFHRLRPRSTGSGLGLNLVQQIIERHDGRVSILSAPEGGTIVRAEFGSR
ncbi:HAMP domain-containing histidine kinase [Rhizobium sp. WYCCWR 11279]|uniref:histidine kinase n=1 Tax=Rhizobium changzhiense TaxID=2692317 RepID=A0A7Z0UHP2_9HYPH|nr:HAMP domain-containing sensor histidine kinase [Rhizobium changzhiense]MCH4547309.1 HAMP domain-containing histidine kinase [Rhizobium changzhiense]NNU49012.1 HAMP domain-containing histidine kinase [Rhizobium changzhiense]NZD65954.1 HAMP domain-containing histidine kinase [Rhizobium changzhiense]